MDNAVYTNSATMSLYSGPVQILHLSLFCPSVYFSHFSDLLQSVKASILRHNKNAGLWAKMMYWKNILEINICLRNTDSNLCLRLDVRFLQAVAFCEVIDLVAALITAVIIDPHGDRVDLRAALSRRAALPRPVLDFIGKVVHFLLQLEGRLLQGRKEAPALRAKRPTLALTGIDGVSTLLVEGKYRAVVPMRVSFGSPHGRSPALVVETPDDATATMALTAQESGECALEFFAGTGVDYRVDAAVEVAQPEDYFEHHLRRLQRWEEGTWGGEERAWGGETFFEICMGNNTVVQVNLAPSYNSPRAPKVCRLKPCVLNYTQQTDYVLLILFLFFSPM